MRHARWSLLLSALAMAGWLTVGCSPSAEQAAEGPAEVGNTAANAPVENAPGETAPAGTTPTETAEAGAQTTLFVKGMH